MYYFGFLMQVKESPNLYKNIGEIQLKLKSILRMLLLLGSNTLKIVIRFL